MKFQVVMKDPDTLWEAIEDAVKEIELPGLDEDEQDAVRERRKQKIRELCSRWFESGEYLTVEVDTEEKTCRVMEVGE